MLFFEFLKTACVVSATLQLCYAYPFAVLNGTTQPFSLIVGRRKSPVVSI